MTNGATSLLLSLLVACNAEPDFACTQIGCNDVLEFEVGAFPEMDITPSSSRQAQVRVCMNNACTTVALNGLPTAIQYGTASSTLGTKNVSVSIAMNRVAPESIHLAVRIAVTDELTFRNGDEFNVSFTTSRAELLFDRAWSVDYATTYPNGAECGACRAPVSVKEL